MFICKQGHVDKIYIRKDRNSARECHECRKITARLHRRKYHNRDNFGGNLESAILRDGEKCKNCGMTREEHRAYFGRDITVDHITGQGAFDKGSVEPDNSLDNLQTLCLVCHGCKDGNRNYMANRLAREVV